MIPESGKLETIEIPGSAIREFLSAKGGKPGSGTGGGGSTPSGLSTLFADPNHQIGNAYVAFHFNLLSSIDYSPYLEDIYNTAMFISSLMNGHGVSDSKEIVTVDLYFEKWVGGTTIGGSSILADPDKDNDGINDQAQLVLNPRYTNSMTSSGTDTFSLLLIHELFHSMGFASDDQWAGLTDSANRFTGENAVKALTGWSGNLLSNPYLESGGGSGTVGSHWEDASQIGGLNNLLAGDLMIGYLNTAAPTQFLSWTTIAALKDFGWGTIYSSDVTYTDGVAFTGNDIANYDVWL